MSAATSEFSHTRSEHETRGVGQRLGERLAPGSVVLLEGELGAGKTAFVKGLAEGLGIDAEDVTSPTFTLIQEYHGASRLFHVDLYRLRSEEASDLGLEELTGGGAVVAIEWPERLEDPPAGAVRVAISDAGGDERRIVISWPGSASPITPNDSSELPS